MKKSRIYKAALALMLGASLTACEDDIDRYNVSGIGSSQFSIAESEIVIDEDNFDVDVLNLIYDKSTLLVNGSSDIYTNLNGGRIILQASTDKDFSKCVDFDGTNLSSVSGATMNAVATKLGLKPNVSSTIYLRLVTSYGANTEETYVSNVVTVPITPFELDSHWAYLYMSEDDDVSLDEKSSTYLYSVNDDGNYAGFINSVAWQKIVIEYDNAFYGTGAAEGWSFLMLGKYDDIANCHTWFTGLAGCYYLQADLKDLSKQPDLYLISSLSCSGDCPQATMVFDKATSTWNGFINVSKDNATITVSGLADHYSEQTAPDATVDCGFSGSDGKASFAVDTEGTGLTGISKGTYKLSINVAKNSAYKYTLEAADIVVYPSAMTINGNELNTETLDGAATGVYTGFLELNSGAAEFKDAEGNVKNVDLNLEKDGWYMVTLNLAEKTASAVLYGNTLTVSGNWTGTLKLDENKHLYVGCVETDGSGWDFRLSDNNGTSFNSHASQFDFNTSGNEDHYWLDPATGDVLMLVDPVSNSWSYYSSFDVVSKDGASTLAALKLNPSTNCFEGEYEPNGNWNFYFKTGDNVYGVADYNNNSGDDVNRSENINLNANAEFGDDYSHWLDPGLGLKYKIILDPLTSKWSFEVTETIPELTSLPTALSVYSDGKDVEIASLTKVEDGIFAGVIKADGWNWYIKGTFDGSDDVVWYGYDGSSKDEALNVPTGIKNGGGNLWSDPASSWNVTVNLNDNTISLSVAE